MLLKYGFYELFKKLILPIELIDKSLPKKGKIVDLGCGEGVISKYLARRADRQVTGVDINGDRLPKISSKNLKFVNMDISEFDISGASGVILSDVLHHLNFQDQRKILIKITTTLRKNSVLIIKEIDTTEFIRTKLSRIWDFLFYPQDKIYYSNSKIFKKFLENLGFKVKIVRSSRIFPGSVILYIARK